jgi:hypothetical protein
MRNINEFKKWYKLIKILLKGINWHFMIYLKQIIWYIKQYFHFTGLSNNREFKNIVFYPCLYDNIKHTPLEPCYFFQDSWAAKKIFELQPAHHYDVASSAKAMSIIAQFIPVTMIDIRPIELECENLSFLEGNILKLPFADNSIFTISSLCVVEHIGLGRYGDKIDQFGSEKAIKELIRVVKVGGYIIISLPVDKINTIYFNAHRAYTRDYVLDLFTDLELIEERYHYGTKLYHSYDILKGFGTGMFLFKKIDTSK